MSSGGGGGGRGGGGGGGTGTSIPQNPTQNPTPTPTPNPNCGVNPVTGTPGFTRNPMGHTGHLRASIKGDGWFNARRPQQKSGRHAGIDIAGVLNTTPVVAFLPGTITFAGNTPGDGGTLVMMDHGHGLTSGYVHLQPGSVPIGAAAQQPVGQGQRIGTLSNSGNAGGAPPHLHFWIKLNGVLQDPEIFLNQPCPP
jgi:murein DD-endopeptidase MepM/ murein hydrolase activator NlpD